MRGTLEKPCCQTWTPRFIPAGAGNTSASDTGSGAFPVHPRGCGEHQTATAAPWAWCGSSPRVRGTPGSRQYARSRRRFIPAGAGNTDRPSLSRFWPSVHPRGCGEHSSCSRSSCSSSGSSPRVRGTRGPPVHPGAGARFIPAGAGNTLDKFLQHGCSPVHPRGCGEHLGPGHTPNRGAGSSPRVRGTLRLDSRVECVHQVHPRGCGEHIDQVGVPVVQYGSSPRVRGTRLLVLQGNPYTRFIPAGAGNTEPWNDLAVHVPVHPRGCGEHHKPETEPAVLAGSSPRVRGTPGAVSRGRNSSRFIPAGAGNTPAPASVLVLLSVHPRGCGEHDQGRIVLVLFYGSSPRVRGTRYDATQDSVEQVGSSPRVRGTRRRPYYIVAVLRFIPAGAGNTRRLLIGRRPIAVHPRGCGEHSIKFARPALTAWFIPAGAGNTSGGACCHGSAPVHPRGCGEHPGQINHLKYPLGSSPRVRGTLDDKPFMELDMRFIPAGAGNTCCKWSHGETNAVHPRGCGEHYVGGRRRILPHGSSPRVRGTRL